MNFDVGKKLYKLSKLGGGGGEVTKSKITAVFPRGTFPNYVGEDYFGKVVDTGDPTHLQPHELGRGGDGLLHLAVNTGVHEDDLDTPENWSGFSNHIIDLDFPK